MAQKPSTPKGTRDFSPKVMLKRNYIMQVIKNAFQTFGYLPIETPSMENSSTLMGKYGEEGDRLIFKILNSGDYLKKIDLNSDLDSKKMIPKISDYELLTEFQEKIKFRCPTKRLKSERLPKNDFMPPSK